MVRPALKRFASGSRWKTLTKPEVRAEEGVHLLRVDRVVLHGRGHADAQPRLDERVAERERAAERLAREVREDEQVVVELDATIDQSESRKYGSKKRMRDELSEPGDLRLQGERLPVAEQVRLLDLRGGDEVLDAREAGADLERAGGPLGRPRS